MPLARTLILALAAAALLALPGSAVATGTIEITVHDLDITHTPAAIHQMTPDLCTTEDMARKLHDLGATPFTFECPPCELHARP